MKFSCNIYKYLRESFKEFFSKFLGNIKLSEKIAEFLMKLREKFNEMLKTFDFVLPNKLKISEDCLKSGGIYQCGNF